MRNRELSTEMRNFINAFNNADIKLEKNKNSFEKAIKLKGSCPEQEQIKLFIKV